MKDRSLQMRRRGRMGGILITAIALVAILGVSAARRAQAQQSSGSQANPKTQSSSQSSSSGQPGQQGMGGMQGMEGMNHGQMNMSQEGQANSQMAMHSHQRMGPHMHMTAKRPATAQDWAKADEISSTLRDAIEKYKDYRVALQDGFRAFLPNLPQPMYHFSSSENAIVESFTFDASRPTSLLYKKTASGYELIGAMYTMPKTATEDQLNERVPLGVAQWHLHTNLCMPARGTQFDMTKYGLTGSITTKQACDAAGGRFIPVLFGWMVHVYPYEQTREKIWEQ